jgi:hypothetical protein
MSRCRRGGNASEGDPAAQQSGSGTIFHVAKSGSFLGSSGYNQVCLMINAKAAATFGVLNTTPRRRLNSGENLTLSCYP